MQRAMAYEVVTCAERKRDAKNARSLFSKVLTKIAVSNCEMYELAVKLSHV